MAIMVIGLGGTGKWVTTYLLQRMIEDNVISNDSGLSEDISVFSIDMIGQEDPPIKLEIFQDGKNKSLELDYYNVTPPNTKIIPNTFVQVNQRFGNIILDLQQGKSDKHPEIARWLKESDRYNIAEADMIPNAAGQRRQCARAVFMQDIKNKSHQNSSMRGKLVGQFKDRFLKIFQSADREFHVFLVGSFAGGTNCGGFIDIANLINFTLYDKDVDAIHGDRSVHTYGIFILPKGFSTYTAGASQEARDTREHITGNCVAAIREFNRMLLSRPLELFEYSDDTHYLKDKSLFTTAILLDGTRSPGNKDLTSHNPQVGIYPAIADFIYNFHVNKTASFLANTLGPVSDNIQDTRNSFPRVFSTIGCSRAFFDSFYLKQQFAYQFIADMLEYRFLARKSSRLDDAWIYPNMIAVFLSGLNQTENQNHCRSNIGQLILNGHRSGDPIGFDTGERLTIKELNNILQIMTSPGSYKKPVDLKMVADSPDLSEVEIWAIKLVKARDQKSIIRELQNRIEKYTGNEDDDFNPSVKKQKNSWWAAANYMAAENEKIFKKDFNTFFGVHIGDPEGPRLAALSKFTGKMIDTISGYISNLKKAKSGNDDSINKNLYYQHTLVHSGGQQKGKKASARKVTNKDLLKHASSYIVLAEKDICYRAMLNLCQHLIDYIKLYDEALENLLDNRTVDQCIEEAKNAVTNIEKIRNARNDVHVWNILTQKGDPIEKYLYKFMIGRADDQNEKLKYSQIMNTLQSVMYEKQYSFENILENRFKWKVNVSDSAATIDFSIVYSWYNKSLAPDELVTNFVYKGLLAPASQNVEPESRGDGYFESLDVLSVWDILALIEKDRRVNVDGFKEVVTKSSEVFSNTLTDGDRRYVCKMPAARGNPQNTTPSFDFWDRFRSLVRTTDETPSKIENEVFSFIMAIGLGMKDFASLKDSVDIYRKRIFNNDTSKPMGAPLHVFAEETLASRFERCIAQLQSDLALPDYKDIPSLRPEVVSTLVDEDDILDFSFSHFLSKRVPGYTEIRDGEIVEPLCPLTLKGEGKKPKKKCDEDIINYCIVVDKKVAQRFDLEKAGGILERAFSEISLKGCYDVTEKCIDDKKVKTVRQKLEQLRDIRQLETGSKSNTEIKNNIYKYIRSCKAHLKKECIELLYEEDGQITKLREHSLEPQFAWVVLASLKLYADGLSKDVVQKGKDDKEAVVIDLSDELDY